MTMMQRIYLLLIALMGCWTVYAQQPTDPAVTAEQLAMLDQLERGERVVLPEKGQSTKSKQPAHNYTMATLSEKYAAREGYTSVVFGRRMMRMMADRIDKDDKELAHLLDEIQTIRILSTKEADAEFETDARSLMKKMSGWELISQIEEGGQKTDTYLFDGGRWSPSTFLLLSFGDTEQVVLYIQGYFSVKDISRLSTIRPQ